MLDNQKLQNNHHRVFFFDIIISTDQHESTYDALKEKMHCLSTFTCFQEPKEVIKSQWCINCNFQLVWVFTFQMS